MLLNKKILKYKRILLFKWGMLLFMLFEMPIFKKIGKHISIGKDYTFVNHNYISIGNNFICLERLRIEAIDKYGIQYFKPEINIGNNVTFNTDVHIGCVNKVYIGNNVLLASRIFISDHSHGATNIESLSIPPNLRPLISKGPVIIEDNVWIGEGVSILSNVTIGKNSIIGANSVVTRSFGENSIIAGVPAKLIKNI